MPTMLNDNRRGFSMAMLNVLLYHSSLKFNFKIFFFKEKNGSQIDTKINAIFLIEIE